jgi:hypothetical protein
MAKKSKVRRLSIALAVPENEQEAAANRLTSTKRGTSAKKGTAAKKKTGALAAKSASGARASRKAASGGKRPSGNRPPGRIALTAPLARARKLSGDLYQSAGLAIWAEAVESAPEPERAVLIQLQDAICDAADLLRDAKATNPKHLQLYWVACFDRDGLPATPPRFITAAGEDEALQIFRAAFKGEVGRRKPRAQLVPALAEKPTLHDSREE